MKSALKSGFVLLPMLLLLSVSGFLLVKTLAQDQQKVSAAINDSLDPGSYRYTLSEQMGSANTWKTYQNKRFNFSIKHPDPWQTQQNTRLVSPSIANYEAFLGAKITLAVTVNKSYDIAEKAKKLELENATFYWIEDKPNQKSVVTQKDNYYYVIELSQEDFFGANTEFRTTFVKILKTFTFTS